MEKFYNEKLYKLEIAINDLEIDTDYSLQRIEEAIRLIISTLSELKESLSQI